MVKSHDQKNMRPLPVGGYGDDGGADKGSGWASYTFPVYICMREKKCARLRNRDRGALRRGPGGVEEPLEVLDGGEGVPLYLHGARGGFDATVLRAGVMAISASLRLT